MCLLQSLNPTFSTSLLSTETGRFWQQGEVLQLYELCLFEGFFFPSLRISQAGEAVCEGVALSIICDLHNPASTQMIDGTEKPKIPSKFAKRAARYSEFRCKKAYISATNCNKELIFWQVVVLTIALSKNAIASHNFTNSCLYDVTLYHSIGCHE